MRTAIAIFFSLALALLSRPPAEAEDAVIITSGGVSLGAYEAGLNWALIELFKNSRSDPASPVKYNVKGLAGASAGGINTLLGSLTWCDPTPTTVNNNLFWKAWIPFGADTMLPLNVSAPDYRLRYRNAFSGIDDAAGKRLELGKNDVYPAYLPEDGLISQRASAYISGLLQSQLVDWSANGAPPPAECRLALGLTFTRVQPVEVEAGGLKTSTQKFFLPLMVSVTGGALTVTNQEGFGFGMDRPLPGKPVKLPSDSGASVNVSPRALVNAVRASAAFPIAFEPINLTYCDETGTAPAEGGFTCPEGKLNTERFSDGGIFNNIPIGLAIIQQPEGHSPLYLTIAPEERSRLFVKQNKTDGGENGGNFAEKTWAEFFSHTVTTAMEAETVLALAHPQTKGRVQATGRFSPITGTYLAHFGAFFDRPFREYDYYAGVYDGVRKFAEMSCGIANGDLPGEYPYACVGQALKAGTASLRLSAANAETADAQFVFRTLAQKEFGKAAEQWDWLRGMREEPHNANLRVIQNALFAQGSAESFKEFIATLGSGYSEVNPPQCAVKTDTGNIDRIRELLFEGHLDLSKYRLVCDPACAGCYLMQDSMRDLQSNYGAWFVRNSLEAIQRLKWLDRQRGNGPSLDLKALNAAEFLLRNDYDTSGYRFLRLNASSVPDNRLGLDHPLYNALFMALPYRIGINTTEGGWILGYDPAIRFNKSWSLTIPVEPYVGANSVNKTFLNAGLMVEFHSQALSGLSVGAGALQFFEWGKPLEMRGTGNTGMRVELGFLWGKVSVGMTQRDYLDPDTRYWAVNFNDINGLIYWALKIRE